MSAYPVIAGIEVPVDEQGRVNLNALHRASGEPESKKPSQWLRYQQAADLINELKTQGANSPHEEIQLLTTIHGGNRNGTYAHELIAISYAGWLSPAFQVQVNQVFLSWRRGELTAPPIPDGLPDFTDPSAAARAWADAIDQVQALTHQQQKLARVIERQQPLVQFAEAVGNASGTHSVREVAQMLGTGQNRLFTWLRQEGLLSNDNLPYQHCIQRGWLVLKESPYTDRTTGRQFVSTQTRVTAAGLQYIQAKWHGQQRRNN